MENASKALIIAGAILLSILIIALGIFIFQKASGAMDTKQLDQMAIQTHNNQFSQYEGTKTGSEIKGLIGNIISNANEHVGDKEYLPKVQIKDVPGTAGSNSNKTWDYPSKVRSRG